MDQVQQVLVQTLVKEEQSIVPQEHLLVVLYQTDTIQQDVIVQIINVQDKASVEKEITVQAEYQMLVEQENIMIWKDNLLQQHVRI